MKRKTLVLLLTTVLSIGLTACAAGENSESTSITYSIQTLMKDSLCISGNAEEGECTGIKSETVSAKIEKVSDNKEDDASNRADDSEAEKEKKNEDSSKKKPPSVKKIGKEKKTDEALRFEPVTINAGDVDITFKEIKPNGKNYYAISVLAENRSDTAYELAVEGVYFNSLSTDDVMYEEIPAGKKVNSKISVDKDKLSALKGDIADIQLYCRITEAADSAHEIYCDKTSLYLREDKETAVYKRKAESSDRILLDSDGVKTTLIDAAKDQYGNYCLYLYTENKYTDRTIYIGVAETSVNDYVVEGRGIDYLHPGTSSYNMVIKFDQSDLAENNINNVESVSFIMGTLDSETMEVLETEKFELNMRNV